MLLPVNLLHSAGRCIAITFALLWALRAADSNADAGVLKPDPAAIANVAIGTETTANAAWWGFDPQDATDSLQAAIDSNARRVRIPVMHAAWTLRPIRLRSNLELELESGVLLHAKAGDFLGGGDSLFRAVDATNIVIRGHGAVLRMRKVDYQKAPYPKAEWRMGLSFTGCRNVLVEGLRVESSGGDGFYFGSSRSNRWCEDIVLRHCEAIDNHRQGLSVISAVNLLVEHCVFSSTSGTAPEAGIDFEPDEADERLVNCVVRDCRVENNRGNGLLVYLKPLTQASHPVSIRFERCHIQMGTRGQDPETVASQGLGGWSGIAVGKVRDEGPQGRIEFIQCTSENTGREAVRAFDKSADGVQVVLKECAWRNTWTAHHRAYSGPRVPILIRCQESKFCRRPGGIELIDCRVYDEIDGPAIRFEDDTHAATLRDVSGTLTVFNPTGVQAWLGERTQNVSLRIRPGLPVRKP